MPSRLPGPLAGRFERRDSSVLVGFISVADDCGRATNDVSGSAKARVSGISVRAAQAVDWSGVQVATVKPGFVCTRVTDGMNLPAELTAEPEELPSAVVGAIPRRRDVVYVQPTWYFVVLVFCAVLERLFNRMNRERSDTARHLDDMPISLYQMGRIMILLVNDPMIFAA